MLGSVVSGTWSSGAFWPSGYHTPAIFPVFGAIVKSYSLKNCAKNCAMAKPSISMRPGKGPMVASVEDCFLMFFDVLGTGSSSSFSSAEHFAQSTGILVPSPPGFFPAS